MHRSKKASYVLNAPEQAALREASEHSHLRQFCAAGALGSVTPNKEGA